LKPTPLPIALVWRWHLYLWLFLLLAQSPTRQEKLAFAGMVVTVLFIALYLPIIGVAAYVFPAIGKLAAQGQEEMIAVMDAAFAERFIIFPFLGGILWHIGPILIGAAIWRSRTL